MFEDRRDAGVALGLALVRGGYRNPDGQNGGDSDRTVVVGLPRGGVLVAAEVARALRAPLEVIVVRKIGHPARRELGLGAVAEGGIRVLNRELIARLAVAPEDLDRVVEEELAEADRRMACYRGDRPSPDLRGRTVVIVDDGVATGYTVQAAIEAVRRKGPALIVLAVPVGSADAISRLRGQVDMVVCLRTSYRLRAVGQAYRAFDDSTDEEVLAALGRGRDGL